MDEIVKTDIEPIRLYCTFYKDGQYKSTLKTPSYLIPYNTNNKEYSSNRLNPYWSEFIVMRNIWKCGKKSEYIGFEQYDVHFPYQKIESIIENDGIMFYGKMNCATTVRNQHSSCHMAADYDMAIDIIEERYGSMCKYANYLRESKVFYYKSCFVMSWTRFNEMCEFIFYVLGEMDKRLGLNMNPQKYEEYYHKPEVMERFPLLSRKQGERGVITQKRAFGYLAERLISAWIYCNVDTEKIYIVHEVGRGIKAAGRTNELLANATFRKSATNKVQINNKYHKSVISKTQMPQQEILNKLKNILES